MYEIKSADSAEVINILNTVNKSLADRIKVFIELAKPSEIKLIRGTKEEYEAISAMMVSKGEMIPLNSDLYSNCYLFRSNPKDVARTEENTYICTENKVDAGPTNYWLYKEEARTKLWSLFNNSMAGKTFYIVPYLLGPVNSPYSQVGIEITSSPYVVLNLMIITHAGDVALNQLKSNNEYVLGIHSTGTLDPSNKYISHFPDERLIMTINTDYGGNALLSKKCHALRIASVMAKEQGWLAEHMMAIHITDPEGNEYGITGAFPSASGKTNLAMLSPPEEYKDWKVRLLSDDIIWMHLINGSLYAINPESGFFGVAPGTNMNTNPNAIITLKKNTIFTNVALTKSIEPWWEGLGPAPDGLIDWQGKEYNNIGTAAHPNSRFTTPIEQYSYLSERYHDPTGMKVSAILFGGRRRELVPLVYEAFSWEHGVLIGAMLRAETTAAITGKVGVLRNDPMAMRPFCGYNMGDYFKHWLDIGKKIENKPKIFNVNWFRRDENGKFIWPGFNENMRVLKWIIERKNGVKENAVETPIGFVPNIEYFDDTKKVSGEVLEKLLHVDIKGWIKELEEIKPFFEAFEERFPKQLWNEYYRLQDRLTR